MYKIRNNLDKEFQNMCISFKIDFEVNYGVFQKSKIYLECKKYNSCLDYKNQLENIIKRRNSRGFAKVS